MKITFEVENQMDVAELVLQGLRIAKGDGIELDLKRTFRIDPAYDRRGDVTVTLTMLEDEL